MSLRVVHVVRQYHPSRGGMEDVVFNIARTQQDLHGHRPRVVTLDRVFRQPQTLPQSEVLDGIPVQRLSWRGSERYPLYPAVLNQVADADVVHVHGIDFAFDYLAATRWLHRKPMVACTHGGFFHTRYAQRAKQLFFHSVTRCSALGYHRILASSANDGDVFRRVVAADRVRVIENGVDLEKFAGASSPTLQTTLIYFGRWSSNKGLPQTMELLRALRDGGGTWRLIIAGREYDLDRAELARLARQAGVENAITLLPNPSDTELRDAIGEASYFVCLSEHEGFGLAAIEAMSAGLLPVLSSIPPFERLAAESRLPLVVDGAVDTASRSVQSRHETLAREHAQVRAQLQAAVQRYSWRSVVGAYVDEYEQAAGA